MIKEIKALIPSVIEIHKQMCKLQKVPYDRMNLAQQMTGNCSGASQALKSLLVEDGKIIKTVRDIYGIFNGFNIQTGSVGYFRHAWLLINETYIVDPTRWVFDGRQPKVFICSRDTNHIMYDEAMIKFRSLIKREYPIEGTGKITICNWSDDVKILLKTLSLSNQDFNKMSSNQIFWLANLPVNVLGELKFEIYDKLISESFKMFIPIDFLKQYEFEKKQKDLAG